MMELCKSESEEEEPATADETNPQFPILDKETSTLNSNNTGPEFIDDLPAVNMTKTTDEELPDLTVEIVPNAAVIEEGKIMKDILNSSAEISQIKPVTDTTEKGNAETKNDFDNGITKESKSNDDSQFIELHYDTEKVQNSEDLESANNSADMKLIFNHSEENINYNEAQQDTKSNLKNSTAEKPGTLEDSEKEKSLELNCDFSDDFSDADINMEDLENIIENAKSM